MPESGSEENKNAAEKISQQIFRLRTPCWICCWFIIVSLGGCTSESVVPEKHAQDQAATANAKSNSDHTFMVKELQRLASAAKPAQNYHLNAQQAEVFRIAADQETDPIKKTRLRQRTAYQLMLAGNIDKSIELFELLDKEQGGIEQTLTRKTKRFYDYLAIAWLRKGEQENCIAAHNEESCILPLSQNAIHQHATGSQNAVKVLTSILRKFPRDAQSIYLLQLAKMTLGQPSMLDRLGNGQSTDLPKWPNVATTLGVDAQGIAGGSAIDDFNNDGYLDIVCSSYRYDDQLRYFQNDRKGGFVDRTQEANLEGITGGLNINHTDFNNDGNLDIWVMRGGWLGPGGCQPNSLLQGNGDGTFQDVTRSTGLLSYRPTQTSVWADFNLDGHLDLFVGNETSSFNYGGGTNNKYVLQQHPCELFMSDGKGGFVESAKAAKVSFQQFVKGVTAADFNGDGYPDLYISVATGKNRLLINATAETSSVQFIEFGKEAGVEGPKLSFPTWSWDFDNDGDNDIFVASYNLRNMDLVAAEYFLETRGDFRNQIPPALYRNNGDGTFTDVAKTMGLNKSIYAMGCNYGDLDNDGFLDFYIGTGTPHLASVVPNRMFRNQNGKSFQEVSFSGFAHIQKGHGVSWGDLDQDGDQDIYAVMGGAYEGDIAQNVLFHNPEAENQWVVIQLQGNRSNRSAIGARVQVVTSKDGERRSIYRTVGTGASFGSNSLQLEIGLGDADQIDDVIIRWPRTKPLPVHTGPLAINKKFRIVQGNESRPELVDYAPTPFSVSKKD